MKNHKAMVLALVLGALLLAACGPSAEAAIATGIAQTQRISALETAAADAGAVQATEAATPEPSAAAVVAPPALADAGDTSSNDNENNNNGGNEVNWTGTWTYLGTGGSDTSLVITQSGDNISGTFTENGETASFNASLSSNHQSASGSWSIPSGYAGTFQWQIQSGNTNQFVGIETTDFGQGVVCGSRSGAPRPSACGVGGNDSGGSTDTDWAGDWNTFYDDSTILVRITVSGNHLEGSFEHNGNIYSFSGTISSDGKRVSGNFNHFIVQFLWQIRSGNPAQFIGKIGYMGGAVGPWCGWRSGSSMPNPCQLP